MEIVETETSSRLNFLFLRDRNFLRLQIFKSNETETFPRLQFWIFWDRGSAKIVETETLLADDFEEGGGKILK